MGLDKFPLIAALVGMLTAAGGTWLLSNVVADSGRRAQDEDLFLGWNGSPTTQALRLREPADNPVQRDKWRSAVSKLTGVELLSAQEEAANPAGADHAIVAATDQLRYLGQREGVPSVRQENVAYGYQRNMYGFRRFGQVIAGVCIAALTVALFGPWKLATEFCIVGILACAAFLTLWTLLPSESRTRSAAQRYTKQLFIAATSRAESS